MAARGVLSDYKKRQNHALTSNAAPLTPARGWDDGLDGWTACKRGSPMREMAPALG